MASLEDLIARAGRQRLPSLPGEHGSRGRSVASLAVALARVANADGDLAPDEVDAIRGLMRDAAGLEADEVERALRFALGCLKDGSIVSALSAGLGKLTSDEKQWLVRALHVVAEADGEFEESELDEIDRIVRELAL